MPGTESLHTVGLICGRLADGTPTCNVPQRVVLHSPEGFEWGYHGSGPADLALNVLHALLPPTGDFEVIGDVAVSSEAVALYPRFKDQVIATLSSDGGTVPIAAIRKWIDRELQKAKETP